MLRQIEIAQLKMLITDVLENSIIVIGDKSDKIKIKPAYKKELKKRYEILFDEEYGVSSVNKIVKA